MKFLLSFYKFFSVQTHFFNKSNLTQSLLLLLIPLSKIIIPDNRKNQLKHTLIRNELGLSLFTIHLVLEILNQVELLSLDDHLLVIQVQLDLFGLGLRERDLVHDLVAVVGGWVYAGHA